MLMMNQLFLRDDASSDASSSLGASESSAAPSP